MVPNIGKVLKNRYKITDRLSIGKYSVVYLGKDLLLKRSVVLKIFSNNLSNNVDLNLTFQNELKITAQLKHRNIVQLYDYFVDKSFLAIVLEYIEGITLRVLLTQKKSLEPKVVVNFMLQILEALKYASFHKIIHRDLKPSNILIVKNKTIKILDFGVALDNYKKTNPIFSRELTGTIHYLSPEAIQQRDLISIQSDIYAVGIVFFELLLGQQPFFDTNPIEILHKHLYTAFPRVTDFDNNISMQIENIIIRATAKNLNERYQKPIQMIRDLQRYINNPDRQVKPLILKSNIYNGKINFPLYNKRHLKPKNIYFWLTKKYLFFFVFVNILLFLSLLVALLYKRFI